MDRRDLGSWLSGPGSSGDSNLPSQAWAGQRLGCPEQGPGAVAGFGRRVGALALDWLGSALILGLVTGGQYGFGAAPEDAVRTQALTLGLFAFQVTLLTWLGGASAGQRILGIGVRTLDRPRLSVLGALARTALICLVIPPVVYDRDGRGLHDRAVRTVVVRTR
jgi:uncharacterized RDD family membrane protein YckC